MFNLATAIQLRDKAARLALRYQDFTVRSLVICIYPQGQFSYTPSLIQVTPRPSIRLEAANKEDLGVKGMSEAVRVYEVKGISKHFSRQQLEQEATEFLIDATATDTPLTGIACHLVQGSLVESDLCWSLKLTERIGEATLYESF